MSLKREVSRRKEREEVERLKKIEKKVRMNEILSIQKEMDARLSGVDEAVRFFEERMESVANIKGIGPKLFKEIAKTLGFEEVDHEKAKGNIQGQETN